jgi:hypothetical protein
MQQNTAPYLQRLNDYTALELRNLIIGNCKLLRAKRKFNLRHLNGKIRNEIKHATTLLNKKFSNTKINFIPMENNKIQTIVSLHTWANECNNKDFTPSVMFAVKDKLGQKEILVFTDNTPPDQILNILENAVMSMREQMNKTPGGIILQP